MSALGPVPAPRIPPRRGGHVIRITCPRCGRELASATYTARELVDLHQPCCLGTPPEAGGPTPGGGD